jgi:hypothetical protein
MNSNYWSPRAKLNTVLLAVLVILLMIALRFIVTHKSYMVLHDSDTQTTQAGKSFKDIEIRLYPLAEINNAAGLCGRVNPLEDKDIAMRGYMYSSDIENIKNTEWINMRENPDITNPSIGINIGALPQEVRTSLADSGKMNTGGFVSVEVRGITTGHDLPTNNSCIRGIFINAHDIIFK